MADCDTTCKVEEKLSAAPVAEDTGSLKRSLDDGSKIEEGSSNKKLKTTEVGDKVSRAPELLLSWPLEGLLTT